MAALALMMAAPAVTPVLACGYDNPDDLAQYYINIDYPKALYLRIAIAKAEAAGVLPPGSSGKIKRDVWALLRTTAKLRELGRKLQRDDESNGDVSISLVLLEPALWTRYAPVAEGYAAQVHAAGAVASDAVVVSDVPVLVALLTGTLTFEQAQGLELVRFYGTEDAQHSAQRLFAKAFGSNSIATLAR